MTNLSHGNPATTVGPTSRQPIPRFVFAATVTAVAFVGGLLLLSLAVAWTDPSMTMTDALGLLSMLLLMMPVVSLGLLLLFGWLVLVVFTLLRDRTRWAALLSGLLPALFFAAVALIPALGTLRAGDDPASALGLWPLVLLPCVAWSALSAAALARLFSHRSQQRASDAPRSTPPTGATA